MKAVFISKLKPFLDATAVEMDLYVPQKTGSHFAFARYRPGEKGDFELNNIRTCTPIKEFLFPLRELAAVFPEAVEPQDSKSFAVFGLKACDIRSIEILDKVFLEKEFEDPFYAARRHNMVIIAGDCYEPAESCFCNVLGGLPFAQSGFDLNVSHVKDGFVVEAGSHKGRELLVKHSKLFADAPDALLAERDKNRADCQQRLERQNAEMKFSSPVSRIIESDHDGDIYDELAATCVECQACTRVCPTCHCFYLHDDKQQNYFTKMKMWDSCMRLAYAQVAGGANPRKALGDRLQHRLMHKFSYFLARYGIDMCVGCGRCVDAEAGGIDIRYVLKKLNESLTSSNKKLKAAT